MYDNIYGGIVMVKFLHTADWHLGLKYKQLGDKAQQARDIRLKIAQKILTIARDNDVDFISTLTLSGTKIFIPPNTDVVFILVSFYISAFFKFKSIPPNIAFKLAPLNVSPSKFNFSPENVA